MTSDEAISLAKQTAQQEGWAWDEPARASKHRRFGVVGAAYWEVVSNANVIGRNVRIRIDDATGEVLQKNFLPR
ncbi:MAG TPA: hypothetical protein VF666_10595 [Pyrinomonadaceae bacterium]|jgi:hypothetical protein